MQRLSPEGIEVGPLVALLPVAFDDIVRGPLRFSQKRREHFVVRLAAIQGIDQRLNNRCGSIEGAQITPTFKIVRLRNVPRARLRGFIVVESQMYALPDVLKMLCELQVHRRRVDGIPAQDQKCFHLPALHFLNKRAQGLPMVNGHRLDGSCILTVFPMFPNATFSLWTKTCVSAGCHPPAMTSDCPAFSRRSLTSAWIQAGLTPWGGVTLLPCTAASIALATAGMSDVRTGNL